MVNYEDKDERKLSEVFMKLPSKRALPEYYELIKNPIDLNGIKTKIIARKYSGLEDFTADIKTMFR